MNQKPSVVQIIKSVPQVLTSDNHALEAFQPDYLSWYKYVRGSTRKNPALAEQMRGILGDHAAAKGTQSLLDAALQGPPQAKRSLKERFARAQGQLSSFRVSATEGGENTILTAAHMIDAILGQDFGAVLSGDMTPRLAWKAAKRRSKGFQRQL